MSKVHPLFEYALAAMAPRAELESRLYSSTAPKEQMDAMKDARTSSIIAAAINSASLTPHEMGEILGAITGRICRMAEDNPEFEETSHDLADSCEHYHEAEDKRDERLHEQSLPEYEPECE